MEAIRVAIAGAGNVAAHLASGIATADGYELVAVASRNPSNAENLGAATTAACRYGDLASFAPDILIVSVADKAIDDVTAAIGPMPPNTVVALTSGTLAKERLAPLSARNGIFYPFQTFTKGYATDLGCVPFFIEGATKQEAEILATLARKLSRSVHFRRRRPPAATPHRGSVYLELHQHHNRRGADHSGQRRIQPRRSRAAPEPDTCQSRGNRRVRRADRSRRARRHSRDEKAARRTSRSIPPDISRAIPTNHVTAQYTL